MSQLNGQEKRREQTKNRVSFVSSLLFQGELIFNNNQKLEM